MIGTGHFGGHFCFITCRQVVQNGTGVLDRAQPQVHVDLCLHRPTSWTFSRKLQEGHKKNHHVSRSRSWASLSGKRGAGDLGTYPGVFHRAVLRSSSYTKMRPMTHPPHPADATMHNPREPPDLGGPEAETVTVLNTLEPGAFKSNRSVWFCPHFVGEQTQALGS